ncbi:hypothetical protein GTZ78_39905, partial [Streptomyces sp. SID8361]
ARRVAGRWDRAGERGGAALGFDTALLLDAVGRQAELEAHAGPGTSLLAVTEPTETATAVAFGHTAVLAGRPGNRAPLEEAGRLFGRLAHLLDAVEDLAEDAESGAWNPIAATGADLAEVRRLCDDAVHGVRLALKDTEFAGEGSGRLAHVLLVHELRRAVDRAFGTTGCAHTGQGSTTPESSYGPPQSPWITPGGPGGAPPEPPHGRRRGLLAGCLVWTGLCCTCQVCCRDPYHDPWSGQPREGLCHKCDDCCDCCDCCGNCSDCCSCDCCDGCDCGCDC